MTPSQASPPRNKNVAIVQSNYLPWKGYFDLIAACDEFILYDDMQYTRRDWRNRNQIKTADGAQWLTVPVKVKGKYEQPIRETEIDGHAWAAQHLRSIQHAYSKTPHYSEIMALLKPILEAPPTHLSPLNRALLETLCAYIGIVTKLTNSWDYTLRGDKSERLADLAAQAGATTYISGPAAKNYLDETPFRERGIAVEWFDYSGYPEYPQLWGAFTHHVSVVDLLFNVGQDARTFMNHVR